jgi:hypothetical protein
MERAKRAEAQCFELFLAECSVTSRAPAALERKRILGFRFAPPQALCCHPLRGFTNSHGLLEATVMAAAPAPLSKFTGAG